MSHAWHVRRRKKENRRKITKYSIYTIDLYFPLVRINPISDRIRSYFDESKKKKADERKNTDNYESLKNKEEIIRLIKYSWKRKGWNCREKVTYVRETIRFNPIRSYYAHAHVWKVSCSERQVAVKTKHWKSKPDARGGFNRGPSYIQLSASL